MNLEKGPGILPQLLIIFWGKIMMKCCRWSCQDKIQANLWGAKALRKQNIKLLIKRKLSLFHKEINQLNAYFSLRIELKEQGKILLIVKVYNSTEISKML